MGAEHQVLAKVRAFSVSGGRGSAANPTLRRARLRRRHRARGDIFRLPPLWLRPTSHAPGHPIQFHRVLCHLVEASLLRPGCAEPARYSLPSALLRLSIPLHGFARSELLPARRCWPARSVPRGFVKRLRRLPASDPPGDQAALLDAVQHPGRGRQWELSTRGSLLDQLADIRAVPRPVSTTPAQHRRCLDVGPGFSAIYAHTIWVATSRLGLRASGFGFRASGARSGGGWGLGEATKSLAPAVSAVRFWHAVAPEA